MKERTYEVIVVGGGHAGCEAARAAAQMGAKTLLISMNLSLLGQMSCNPAMGGVAKGQIIREIDALGGGSAAISDDSMIQFRMLNRSKGPAMWSPRTQNDRMLFAALWKETLEKTPHLYLWQDMVSALRISQGKVVGVETQWGLSLSAQTVILTNGTFLNGQIHIGKQQQSGGRMGEKPATRLTEQLTAIGFQQGRMKTGTPPRLDGKTIDFSLLEEQKGDEQAHGFRVYHPRKPRRAQRSCYIAYTCGKAHDFLRKHLQESAMYNGQIQSTGPRYCPSIEDKVIRFADKERHILFLEPEGWRTQEIYINGFSTSLPWEIQLEALRMVKGLSSVHMLRPGYAIEYDYFIPTQLKPSLETQKVRGLFFAGQINGTTGYEEAACQGLMAGINAVARIREEAPLILGREEAYIGVLIDDLVHKGTDEPYRMFTSRAEYRLSLRQDNADVRLGRKGVERGLLGQAIRKKIEKKEADIAQVKQILHKWKAKESTARAGELLRRPAVHLKDMENADSLLKEALEGYSEEVKTQAEIHIKYAPYLEREAMWVKKKKALAKMKIQETFDYSRVKALSNEGREKLQTRKPKNLAEAEHISGVSASDISVLSIYLGR